MNQINAMILCLIFKLKITIEHLYEKISILRKKHLINERYTCGRIGAHGIWIRGEVSARVVFLENSDLSQVLDSNIHLHIHNSLYFSVKI